MPARGIVDLSFAGREIDAHDVHQAVRSAKVGDSLSLVFQQRRWFLLDAKDRVVGRMAKLWQPPQGHMFVSGQIGAIINWRKIDNKKDYVPSCRRDSWETILPELVFQPEAAEKVLVAQKVEVEETSPKQVKNEGSVRKPYA